MTSLKRTFYFLIVISILLGGGIAGIAYANNNESKLSTAASNTSTAEVRDRIVTEKPQVSETVKRETAETVTAREASAAITSEDSPEVTSVEGSEIASEVAVETTAEVSFAESLESEAETADLTIESSESIEPEIESIPEATNDTKLPANIVEEDVIAAECETAESIAEVGSQAENRRIIAERVGIDISALDQFTDAEIAAARAAAESIGGDPGYSYNYLLNDSQHLPGVPVP